MVLQCCQREVLQVQVMVRVKSRDRKESQEPRGYLAPLTGAQAMQYATCTPRAGLLHIQCAFLEVPIKLELDLSRSFGELLAAHTFSYADTETLASAATLTTSSSLLTKSLMTSLSWSIVQSTIVMVSNVFRDDGHKSELSWL